jgi:hypothetical protein
MNNPDFYFKRLKIFLIITCGLSGALNAELQASEVPVVSNCNFAVELLSVDIDGDGYVDDCRITIEDTEFLDHLDDNCTLNIELELRVQRQNNGVFDMVSNPGNLAHNVTFTIYDYDYYTPQGHDAPVRIWVGDDSGNWDYCLTFVTIQNNMVGPCEIGLVPVNGVISTEENETVENVTVTSINTSTNQTFEEITGNNGSFTLFAEAGIDYIITPYRNNDPLNGVSTWDLVLITKHILGTQPLGSPYKLIAADINNNGVITANDLVELRKVILHINDNYPDNTAWRFIDANFIFPDAANPWLTDFPEMINFINQGAGGADIDFIGVHTGDVNGSADAINLSGND